MLEVMQTPKREIINRYILPLFTPLFDFFAKYGIKPITVLGVLAILVSLLSLRRTKKNSTYYVLTIVGVVIFACIIIYYQFFYAS
jgi:hypothetical protein